MKFIFRELVLSQIVYLPVVLYAVGFSLSPVPFGPGSEAGIPSTQDKLQVEISQPTNCTAPIVTAAICQEKKIDTKSWDRRFGGNSSDVLHSMVATSDGGFLLGGYSNSGIGGDKTQDAWGNSDYWVVRIDANGTKLWDRRFGGTSSDVLYSIVATSDGGFLLGGYSNSDIGGDKSEGSRGLADYWVVRIDANGTKLWDRRFGGSSSDYMYDILATSDGGFLLGGWSESGIDSDKTEGSRGLADYWIVKIDSNGAKLWDRCYGGASSDYFTRMLATSDGGFLLGGYSSSGIGGDKTENSQGVTDYWVVRLDSNGGKLWDRRFGGALYEHMFDLAATSDGAFLLGGQSNSGVGGDKTEDSRGNSDYWVVLIDASGTKLWDRRFGGASYDNFSSILNVPGGGFLLGGKSSSGVGGDKTNASRGRIDYWVVNIDASGGKLWDKGFGGSADDNLRSLVAIQDGAFLLGGDSGSGIGGDRAEDSRGLSDFWVVKMGTTECKPLEGSVCAGTTVTLTASGCAGTINWSTGSIGTTLTVSPQQTTTYTATCTVNGCTSQSSQPLTISIAQQTGLTHQPTSSATVAEGGTATATIVASGDSLTYQWYKGLGNSKQAVVDQTSATLSLASVQANQSGTYYCLVTGQCGSAWSEGFTLTVSGGCTDMYTIKTGDWNDPLVWSCGRVPTSTDDVTISAGHSITVTTSGSARSLAMQGSLNYLDGMVISLGQ